MSSEYDKVSAFHYAAYRPELHKSILHSCLGNQKFTRGLDIGCGTGVSSVALSHFCTNVIGVDPNEKMLSQAVTEDNINYQLMVGNNLPFANGSFDICTYAGAWWYGKSQALLEETIRVSAKNGTILLYDFELDFKKIYNSLNLFPPDLGGYDHRSNFENLDTSSIQFVSEKTEEMELLLAPTEIGHLLCSEKPIYNQLVLKFGTIDTFDHLVKIVTDYFGQANIPVTAVTYYTLYRLLDF